MDLSREATGVRLDPRCGHVSIYGAQGPALVTTMVDTGKQLELWSHQAAHLSPEVARDLAAALLAWAERKAGQERASVSGPMECPPRPPAEPLACNAQGIRHDGHKWDFGSGETFQCPGDPNGVIPPGESDA